MSDQIVLVDSNVLLDVLTHDPNWYEWSAKQMHEIMLHHLGAINQLIYAEVSSNYQSQQEAESVFAALSLRHLELPWEAAFPAAHAFNQYRRRGGKRRSPLPDFYIGAHAHVQGMRLLTRDVNRFRTYFPSLELICPE